MTQINRIDNWTSWEDEVLTATILRNIREGKTQLEAFGEATKRIDRTYAACNFRWNKYLRHKNLPLIAEAKRLGREARKGNRVIEDVQELPLPTKTYDLQQMIRDYVQDLVFEALSQRKG